MLKFVLFLLVTFDTRNALCHSMMNLPELLQKGFVKTALTRPNSVGSILSFWFGVDYNDEPSFRSTMKAGKPLEYMSDLWYSGGLEFDHVCKSFQDTIRGVSGVDWPENADSYAAKLILCDQISRNAFRGSDEAFAYEDMSLVSARWLTENMSREAQLVTGEVFPPYIAFAIVAFMHSESLADHEHALKVIKEAKETTPKHLLDSWNYQEQFLLDHKRVIEAFGRYPHRNRAMGRENTEKEVVWLADVENLPGWAKSQL